MSSNKRLDSISRPSGTRQHLKFKPKVVARKSKAERESSPHVNTPGVNMKAIQQQQQQQQQKPSRFQAGGKSKLNKRYQNTTLLSAGPLSAGAVSVGPGGAGNGRSGATSGSRSSSPAAHASELVSRLRRNDGRRVKTEPTDDVPRSTGSAEHAADGEDDYGNEDVKINMGEQLQDRFDPEDIASFPVRAERSEHYEYGEEPKPDDTIKTEFRREESVLSSREPSVEPAVKLENADDILLAEGPPDDGASASATAGADAINEYQTKQERSALRRDYESMVHYMGQTGLSEKDEVLPSKFLFLQLPPVLPQFEKPCSGQDDDGDEEIVDDEDEAEAIGEPRANDTDEVKEIDSITKKSNIVTTTEAVPQGIVGKLQYHRSGKVTMKIGEVEFDLSGGGDSSFEQVVIAVDPESKVCYHMGTVGEKIIGAPKLA